MGALDDTPNLTLPYIMAAQAQKHVTHNEALRALDCIVQLSVLDRDLTAPPVDPANGDRYIVAAPATGAWAGQESNIAAYQDGAWLFYVPREGWMAWIADADIAVVWDGLAWSGLGGGGGGSGGTSDHGALAGLGDDDHPQYLNSSRGDARYDALGAAASGIAAHEADASPHALLGINATADATNRLSVNAPASLFNHDGNGHQQKINKANAARTASVVYQTNFSGRAEIGTTGDDNFHFKVSADGTTFREAMIIDRGSGAVTHLAGARHTFAHDVTTPGLRLVPAVGDPTTVLDGDLWYNATLGRFRKRQGGTISDLDTTGGAGGIALSEVIHSGDANSGSAVTVTNIAPYDEIIVYLSFVSISTTGQKLYVQLSSDNGASWGSLIAVSPSFTNAGHSCIGFLHITCAGTPGATKHCFGASNTGASFSLNLGAETAVTGVINAIRLGATGGTLDTGTWALIGKGRL